MPLLTSAAFVNQSGSSANHDKKETELPKEYKKYLETLGELSIENPDVILVKINLSEFFLISPPTYPEYQQNYAPSREQFITAYQKARKDDIREYADYPTNLNPQERLMVISIPMKSSTSDVPSTQPTPEHKVPTDGFFSSLFSSVSGFTSAILSKLSNVGSLFRSNKATDPVSPDAAQITSDITQNSQTSTEVESTMNLPSENKSFFGKIFDIFHDIGSFFDWTTPKVSNEAVEPTEIPGSTEDPEQ